MCNNIFIEEDGYCTQCGKKHPQPAKRGEPTWKAQRQEQQHEQTLAERERTVRQIIDSDPDYSAFEKQFKEALALYGIAQDTPIIWRNRMGGFVQKVNGKWICVMGYQFVKYEANNGIVDYRADWVVKCENGIRPHGSTAAKYIALHEAAHIVHDEKYGRRRGQMHPSAWANIFNEMVELFL